MRLLYFGIYNTGGGLENFSKNLLTGVSKNKDIEIFILSTIEDISFKDYFLSIGCNIIKVPNPHNNPISFYFCLYKLLRKYRHNSVLQLNICSFRNTFLFLASKLSGIKTIIVGHYTKIDDGKVPFFHYVNRFVFSKFALNVSNSSDVSKFMFNNKNYIFVANGIDVNVFRFDPKSRVKIRKELGVSDNCFLIGQVGRISSEKNQLFSIDVLKTLLMKTKKIKMCFVGKELDPSIRKMVENNSLSDYVIFTGAVFKDIQEYYSAFDVCLLPSKNEGLSLSFLESISCNVPSFYSTAVPMIDDVNINGCYLSLDTNIWVKNIESIFEKLNFIKRNTISPLKNTQYDFDLFVQKYVDLYYSFNIFKRDLKND